MKARHGGFANRRLQACLAKQNINAGRGARGAVNTQAGRGIALRVKVVQQNRLTNGGQRRAEIDCRGGFADPALRLAKHIMRGANGACDNDDGRANMRSRRSFCVAPKAVAAAFKRRAG